MKTKLFTGLALAVALLLSTPAYAHDHRGGARGHGGRHAVAAVHRGGGSMRVASSHHARTGEFRGRAIAARRTFTMPANRGYASTGKRSFRSRSSVAFGGSPNYSRGYANNGRGNNRGYTYAFASHPGWNHNQEYAWNGHHYRWYDNAWYIIDPFPYYAGYGYGYYGYPNGGSVSVQVQADLARDGYYQGPVDGIVGPGTRAAIAAFQQDNGLRVTGTITRSLLAYLGVG